MFYHKSKRQRLLALFCSLILLVGILAVPASAANKTFIDVNQTAWYDNAVDHVSSNGLMTGVSSNEFAPNKNLTRVQLAQILYNMSDHTAFEPERHFSDVKSNQWYYPAVEYCANYEIVFGTGRFSFSPNKPITRQDAAVMLYRYVQKVSAQSPSSFLNVIEDKYKDANKIAGYARDAFAWAVQNKIISGRSHTMLCPTDFITRAEIAQILFNARDILTTNNTLTQPDTPSVPAYDPVRYYASTMTYTSKIGQLFMPRYSDDFDLNDLCEFGFAGFVLYEKDFKNKTRSQVQSMIRSIQMASNTPMFIAVDEEGGTVNRVSTNPNLIKSPFQSMQDLYKTGGLNALRNDAIEKSQFLTGLGINLNLAPVCDVSVNSRDYIFKRTLGKNAVETSDAIKTIVSEMNENKLGAALKHFPGYGNNLNTHTGISIDKRPLASFEASDFLPFKAGIEAGAGSVLVSHNIMTCLDPDAPASLSKPVHGYLRNELGFNGVIMTDDLSMQAIKDYSSNYSPAVAALLAGNDLILTSDAGLEYNNVLRAVAAGIISEDQIDASVDRILKFKASLGII